MAMMQIKMLSIVFYGVTKFDHKVVVLYPHVDLDNVTLGITLFKSSVVLVVIRVVNMIIYI